MEFPIFQLSAVHRRHSATVGTALRKLSAVLFLLAVAVTMTACAGAAGGTQSSAAPVVPVSIVIAAPAGSQAVGDSHQFSATAVFSDGRTRDVTAQSTWASSAGSVATIAAANGFETALAAGDTIISASFASGGAVVRASTPLHVKLNIVSLFIEPTTAQLELGANQQFTATATLGDGSTIDVTQAAIWSSSDESVVRVNTTRGRVALANTRGPGRVTVSAVVDGIERSTTVSVTRRTPKFLYVAGINGINGYSITPASGLLSPVTGAQFTAVGGISALAVSRDRRFLYAADVVLGVIWAFGVDTSGALVSVPNSPFFTTAVSSRPISLVADPAADFLFMTDASTGDITTFTIVDDGSLVAATSTAPVGREPLFATISPDGKFIYQGLHVGSSAFVAPFSVATDGTLAASPAVDIAFRPLAMTVDPSGQFLFATIPSSSLGPSTSVFGYSIDAASGALTLITGSPFSAGESPTSVAADPSGRFLYVANNATSADGSSISAFSIDVASGVLTNVPGTPFSAVAAPAAVAVDPGGHFVYAGFSNGQGVRAFAIDEATGALTEIPGSRVPALGPIQAIATTY